MKDRNNIKRIAALLLSFVMTLSMSGFAFTEVFADDTEDIEPITRRTISVKSIDDPSLVRKSGKAINLRSMLGEKDTGYSVVQGSCTDGKYAYYMMVSSANQKGRVLKVRMSDRKVVGKSKALDVNHGNGMCYDSKRDRLVIVTYYSSRKLLVFVDAKTLELQKTAKVKFKYYNEENDEKYEDNTVNAADRKRGLTAIAYNARYDCYVGMESGFHDIIIYNAETLQAIGKANTKVTEKYPGVWQSMDADDQYVYYVLSRYNGSQPYNIILCLDWHSENLEPVRKGEKKFIEEAWYCGKQSDPEKRTGTPSRVIRVNTPYEIESLYHTTDSKTGQHHFYLSEYHSSPKYGWVTKKVKWKKVKKKVKWKKVKKNGKWKWKYKKKKVWKYKKVRRWQQVGINRDDNVYDIGVF
ncbi:MAG: hypothetical protein IJH43_09945 [Mogibacterium sp.]|nr:hypothetical protein [Mogibacterium sp.]